MPNNKRINRLSLQAMMLYLLPIIAALTGWITNYIAVKMLFHPREKVKILFLEIQGIFPKRQEKLAEKLGDIVANELFSFADIKSKFNDPAALQEVYKVLDEKLEEFIQVRLPAQMPMLAMFLNDDLKAKIKGTIQTEFENALPDIIERYVTKLEGEVDIRQTVYEKVVNFSSDKLEEILYSIMKKEFRFIEILGGVLGFMIGLIQVGLVMVS